ncbi:hypothetical protein R1flu_013447 [Riccia fluitans]|uniref:AMP-dependent synthetase/ligase domain-containing protein n=1 Tax=Riccia fluitans TaxID=41844 RepID=A0ABD1YDK9_9MARC
MELKHTMVVSLLQKVCQENATNLALVGMRDVWRKNGRKNSVSIKTSSQDSWSEAGSSHRTRTTDRSFDHIVAIFAVIDAGGMYVPMEPELPQQRLAYMIKDAHLVVILTQHRYILDWENTLSQHQEMISSQFVLIDGLIDKLTSSLRIQVQSNLKMLPEPYVEDLAFMIYTSGSTGEPKGVMVPHRGLLALSVAAAETWELRKAESRMLQFSSHCFDASILQNSSETKDWL